MICMICMILQESSCRRYRKGVRGERILKGPRKFDRVGQLVLHGIKEDVYAQLEVMNPVILTKR